MALSYSDIEGVWIRAGGRASSAPLAAAIAMAESGGNPNAHNGNASTGDDSWGLWQINMLGSLGTSRRKQFKINADSALLDPLTNARAAVALSSNGNNFTPWTTFTSGAFKQFLNGSMPPNLSGGIAGPAQDIGVVNDFVGSVLTPIEDAFENVLNYMYMGGLVVLGVMLMLGAVWAMVKDTDTINTGSGVVKTLIDVALLRKVVK